MNNVIVAGGRDFSDYALLKKSLDNILSTLNDVCIISGGARGADKLGERCAKENSYPLEVFEAEGDTYGKAAGYKRNERMAAHSRYCVVFWDSKSIGSGHMITIAKRYGLKVRVVRY